MPDLSRYTYPPVDLTRDYSREELLFSKDPRPFLELCLKVPTQRGLKPMHLWPWMNQVCYDGITNRELMLKSREIGSTTLWIGLYLRDMLATGGNTIIGADKEKNARNAMKYVKPMVYNLPPHLRPVIGQDNLTEMTFPELHGGCAIEALPGNVTSGRSSRARRVLGTEAAFWELADEYFVALTGANVGEDQKIVLESTANSLTDMFHEMWFDVSNGYRKHFYGREENPEHTPAWWAQKQKDIRDKRLLLREYPISVNEAFQKATEGYFKATTLEAMGKSLRPPKTTLVLPDGAGLIAIWQEPQPGRHYVAGVDTAEGKTNKRGKRDWSDLKLLDWQTGQHVLTIHCQLHVNDFSRLVHTTAKQYNNAHLCIERQGGGLAVLSYLQAVGYGNLFHQMVETSRLSSVSEKERVPGFHTNQKTKPVLLSQFADACDSHAFSTHDEMLVDEMKSFGVLLEADPTAHDDSVLAAALAWAARQQYNPQQSIKLLTPAQARAEAYQKSRRRRSEGGPVWARMF